ncbi:MAG: SLC13 family permease [Planctomycetes bacterium]|nr:SLC13 family permease [Planctomycetota bacterium]
MADRTEPGAGRKQSPWRIAGFAAGLIAGALILLLDSPLQHHGEYGSRPARALAVTALMAIWWLTEALPIYVTACVPLVLFPLLRVFEPSVSAGLAAAARPYVDAYIFLFLGGMCIAAAMQQWNLHRRIALSIMAFTGTRPKRLLLGVLLATVFISMWISNTATATMMVPIGLAVIHELERRMGGRRLEHFGAAIMLAIAYGANVGGIGTKIGTAPNAQFSGFLGREGIEISFLQFLVVGTGFVVLFTPIVGWALWRVGRRDAPGEDVGAAVLAEERAKLGPLGRGEVLVACVFCAAAALWIGAKPLTAWLAALVPGFPLRSAHVEAGIALAAALVLFCARIEGRAALEFASLRWVPWATLLLLGGGFSMAAGVQESGLSHWIGGELGALSGLSPLAQLTLASLAAVAISAVASNTATIGVMLPVLWGAVPREQAPALLFAATIACSCDFALPAGTPPNAIVFGSGYVGIPRMAKTGAWLDLVAAGLAAAWCWLVVDRVL